MGSSESRHGEVRRKQKASRQDPKVRKGRRSQLTAPRQNLWVARDHLTAWTGWAVCRVRRDIASRRAGSAPGRGKGQLRTTGLANGTYTGQSTGFYAPLNVEIKVANGMLAGVRVVKHREDRPRNALDGFVKRLKGPAPLAIDAVTGATQTCHGVLLAAEEALRKAAPRGLQTLSQTQ